METFKTEKQKMIDGELYFASDPELVAGRKHAREQMKLINNEADRQIRRQLVEESFGSTGSNAHIEPEISFDYGYNIHVGKNFYANFNSIFLDICPITIGDNCMFGPNVQLYTASHPLNPVKRNSGLEFGKPITIGDNVWLGGGVIIIPGVTLGDNVVVAAGSVVTESVPDNYVVGGNPARFIKSVEDEPASESDDLDSQREKIDLIDRKIIALLEQRMDAVTEIAAIKKSRGQKVFDPSREEKILEKAASYAKNEAYREALKDTYQGIMDVSKKYQKDQIDK
ncbi:chorismate mutase [Enterococcus sp. BWT-B8]|uniref:chorismate mutase n=1 Tax=Enterococcus sp. BWT-B8 TaxID=2885157 RepID=UPI001E43CB53|nr:chorismate mutase [Enterococcus sp. BWT-B8]MCB5952910.1 chorismate mutase [Enterococcus sp. BWT-B8]